MTTLTRVYGFTPLEIRELTWNQYCFYIEEISAVLKLTEKSST